MRDQKTSELARTPNARNAYTMRKLAAKVHKLNERWWRDIHTGKPIDRDSHGLLMLVITELAEAAEGVRKGLKDDKLPHRSMEEVEMADAAIRLLDFIGGKRVAPPPFAKTPISVMSKDKLAGLLAVSGKVFNASFYLPGVYSALIAIQHYCEAHRLDLWAAVSEKLEYNKTRRDHTHEARRAAGGKKL